MSIGDWLFWLFDFSLVSILFDNICIVSSVGSDMIKFFAAVVVNFSKYYSAHAGEELTW